MDKKRRNLFWHLNLMDKAFAIIFRKSPTFNRKMIREIGPPTVQEFLPTTDKISGGLADAVGVFTAHYVHQKVLLSYLMHDIWTYLYDEESSELSRIDVLLGNLKAWYDEAWKVSITHPWIRLMRLTKVPSCRYSKPPHSQRDHSVPMITLSQWQSDVVL
jgi:hypothetical protein